MFKNLLIMAAGRSTRMWPLTEYVPKAMALANNKTLLQNAVEKYLPFGLNIHLTVGYKREVLAPHALSLGVNSLINTNGYGNAWWIYNTMLSSFNEPVLVLTCDSLMDIDLHRLYSHYLEMGSPACMILPAIPKEGFDGDFIHHEWGKVTKLSREEKTAIYGSGCQVINPHKIKTITQPSEDFLDVWAQLINLNQLYCANFTATNWFTFDSVEQLKKYRETHS
jgi:NDP-sugar pyrophosphorylase family protein